MGFRGRPTVGVKRVILSPALLFAGLCAVDGSSTTFFKLLHQIVNGFAYYNLIPAHRSAFLLG